METARRIFIGDIHGCYDEFMLLLEKLNINNNDKIYLVGDLINKGPDSYKVLKYVYKNRHQFYGVKGNHEVYFLKYINGEIDSKYDAGNKKLNKLQNKIIEKQKEKYIEYIQQMPLYIEEDDFILVHGGVIEGKSLDNHTTEEITKLRQHNGELWHKFYTGDKQIIYGHNAIEGLRMTKNTLGLDSGCVYGRALSAYILETGEIIQQQALNIYVNVNK